MKQVIGASILILLSISSMLSCKQTGLAVQHATQNLVTTPLTTLKEDLLDDTVYGVMSAFANDPEGAVFTPNTCAQTMSNAVPYFNSSLDDTMSAIRDQSCGCTAWGSCHQDVCQCSTLCPNGFEILQRGLLPPTPDNQLPWLNSYYDYQGSAYQMTGGYCWGIAAVTSRFNNMAFFTPNTYHPQNFNGVGIAPNAATASCPARLTSSGGSINPDFISFVERHEALYKSIIDDIVDNRAREIPCFGNLMEFASMPNFQEYIKEKTSIVWAQEAMTFQGLGSITMPAITSADYAIQRPSMERNLFDLKRRVHNYQRPQIVFTKDGKPQSAHTVIVLDVIDNPDGSHDLCIQDSNEYVNTNCANKMNVSNANPPIVTYKGNRIGYFTLAHNNESDTLQQIYSLRHKCMQLKGCPIDRNFMEEWQQTLDRLERDQMIRNQRTTELQRRDDVSAANVASPRESRAGAQTPTRPPGDPRVMDRERPELPDRFGGEGSSIGPRVEQPNPLRPDAIRINPYR